MVGFVLTKEALDELDKEIAYSKQRWNVSIPSPC
jgi:hypothetical protein